MTKSYKPSNTPTLIPYLTVINAEDSIKFYEEAFGLKAAQISKNEKNNITHVEMKKEDVTFMFSHEGAYTDSDWGAPLKSPATMNVTMPISLYVYCPDVDALYQQAIAHGAKSVKEPQDAFWGDRFCQITDINGYTWLFGTFLGDKSV